jgi:predicted lipoprotein
VDWQKTCQSIYHLLNMSAMKKSLLCFLLTALLCGCGGNGGEPTPVGNDKDRSIMLTHWADNIIIPSYQSFKTRFDIMREKATAFTTAPDQNSLSELREAWVAAYAEWQRVELFEFGPADKYTLRSFFNIYPTDETGVAANIANPSSNLDVPAAYPTQGFPAIDYLINGLASSDEAILSHYTTDADAAARIAYLNRIVDRMNTLLTNVVTEWATYRDTFISKSSMEIGSSTGNVVNAYILHYERYIRSGKIGIPSGSAVGTSGIPNPEKVEAYYKKDISRTLAENANEAAKDFFNGIDPTTGLSGPSFQSYLDGLGTKDDASGSLLSDIINNQFTTINAKLDALSPNLYEQVQTNNQAMIDVYTEMQKMVRLLKVDMTSAMSATITYTDNDGD